MFVFSDAFDVQARKVKKQIENDGFCTKAQL